MEMLMMMGVSITGEDGKGMGREEGWKKKIGGIQEEKRRAKVPFSRVGDDDDDTEG